MVEYDAAVNVEERGIRQGRRPRGRRTQFVAQLVSEVADESGLEVERQRLIPLHGDRETLAEFCQQGRNLLRMSPASFHAFDGSVARSVAQHGATAIRNLTHRAEPRIARYDRRTVQPEGVPGACVEGLERIDWIDPLIQRAKHNALPE